MRGLPGKMLTLPGASNKEIVPGSFMPLARLKLTLDSDLNLRTKSRDRLASG